MDDLYLYIFIALGILFYLFQNTKNEEGFTDLILPKSNTCIQEDCNKGQGLSYSSLYTSETPRSLYVKEGRLQDQHYSSRKTPKEYNPPCLTKKPYGNSNAMYRYWEKLPKILVDQYKDCDKYTCKNNLENGYNALPRLERCIQTQAGKVEQEETLACDVVNQEYYNSPEEYCRNHPEDYPCPNWWRKNPEQVRDVTLSIDNMCFPKHPQMIPRVVHTKNNLGFCLANDPNCKITDGRGLLMVQRGREDHAAC